MAARPVKTGPETCGYVAYLPEYYSGELTNNRLFFKQTGGSPLGFIECKDAPFAWNGLNDLAQTVIEASKATPTPMTSITVRPMAVSRLKWWRITSPTSTRSRRSGPPGGNRPHRDGVPAGVQSVAG